MRVEQRWSLARAVARGDHARLLDENNQSSPPVPLVEAVRSGQAFFVTPRAELLVVDVDLPDDPSLAADVLGSFDLLMEAADRSGVPHVSVASGRPGHHHGYLVVGSGSARLALETWCRERGMDVRDRGVRPPGSPHRSGQGHAELLGSVSAADAVAVLTSPVVPEASAAMARALVPVVLPARVRAAMRYGSAAAGYASPSHARMALAVAVRSRGGPRALMEALLNDGDSPLGETFRARPAQWRAGEVRRLWDKAGAWLVSRPAQPTGSWRVREVRDAAATYGWRGMSGGSDLAVIEALCRIGERAGTVRVAAALADLAIGAGVSVDTARVAVRRLERAGWVHVVCEATARTARVYELRVPDGAVVGGVDVVGEIAGDLGADLARWRALGKVTMRVARAVEQLAGRPHVRELADVLAMSPAAVRYHLRKLARVALVARTGRSWAGKIETVALGRLEEMFAVCGLREAARVALAQVRAQRAQVVAAYRRRWELSRVRPAPGPGVLTTG